MMTRHHLTDPRSDELLFLTDGRPDLSVMTGIFAKEINVYRPIETPTILTTVDASGQQLCWPPTDARTTTTTTIPLIPAWEPIELPEAEIAGFDFWTRCRHETTVPIHWTELQRPNLGPSLEPVVESLLRLRDSVVPTNPTNPTRQLLPPHVIRLLIDHAIQTNALCPITMDPILAETAAVTPCGHVFDRTALETWYAEHNTCPECRS